MRAIRKITVSPQTSTKQQQHVEELPEIIGDSDLHVCCVIYANGVSGE